MNCIRYRQKHSASEVEFQIDDGGLFHAVIAGWCLQGGLSNKAFEDNFVPDVPLSELRDVFRERDELKTQLECATDELRQYKPEYVHPLQSYFFLLLCELQ